MSSHAAVPDRKALLKQALTALDEMQAKLDASERTRREPIAVVGMSCRLPGGIESPEALWAVLDNGIDAVSEVPRDRWNIDDYYDPDPKAAGKMITRRGGFLTQVDRFDPQFFGIAPREAQSMDPQQRLLLEVSWEALERAGQAPDRLQGSSTGVFVGITTNDYKDLIDFKDPKHSDVYAATGNALNAAAGRLAFTLGLQGPCMALDTACSSSLVALHNACLSLRSGESDLALAAGVNVILAPETFVLFSKWGMLAADGRCKTFDARADGFVRGEGCVAVVLKRLSDAVAQGDDVLAMIRGSAVNQDGRSSGLTVPNGLAQQAVIRRALGAAGVQPSEVSYVEAHGTGTPLGDPIEVEALAAVLGKGRKEPLAIGSIKTNIGHVEAASGLAGLMKVVLAMRHGRIPKHLHFESANPRIAWDAIPVTVAADAIDWDRGGRRRIAGVSSFGFSGTNAHVILEEAPPTPSVEPAPTGLPLVLTLSAKTPRSLERLAGAYRDVLSRADRDPGAVCFTANTGRARFHHRLAVLGASAADFVTRLGAAGELTEQSGVFRGQTVGADAPKLAFLFTGQGSQYPGMARGLYESEPVFRAAIDRSAAILGDHLTVPLLDALYGADGDKLVQTACTQPALFAVEYALAQLWRSWGVVPTVVLGHSVGEYVAACVADVLDLEDALTLIAARARLMQSLPSGGAMHAVFAPETAVKDAIAAVGGPLSIAAVNGPESTVVSGAEASVNAVVARLALNGIKSQRLSVSHAFHSPLMEPMLDEFEAIAATIKYRVPQIALISNESANAVRAGEIDAAYWRRHIRAAVQFHRSIAEVRSSGCELFVEAGPSPTLIGLGRRCVQGGVWLASLRQGRDDRTEMLSSAAALYARGLPVDFGATIPQASRRHVALPTYPFERERFWVRDANVSQPDAQRHVRRVSSSLAGRRLISPLAQVQFETELAADGWLAEHVIHGAPVFPATGHIELAREAAERAFGRGPHELVSITNHEPLVLPASEPCRVQVIIEPPAEGSASFRILSLRDDGASDQGSWQLHVSGAVRVGQPSNALECSDSLDGIRARCSEPVDVGSYYAEMAQRGLEYGPRFRGVTALWEGPGEAIGRVELLGDGDNAPESPGGIHPALLDSCFHVVGRAIAPDARGDVYLPVGTDRVVAIAGTSGPVWSHAVVRDADGSTLAATIRLFDDAGQPIAIVEGLRLKRMAKGMLARWAGADERQWLHEVEWIAADVPAEPATAKSGGTWLVFADEGEVAESFKREQLAAGDGVVLVRTAQEAASDAVAIDPDDLDSYVRVVKEHGSQLRAVVFAPGLDISPVDDGLMSSERVCRRLLLLTQAVLRVDSAERPRLIVLTRGAAPIVTSVDVGQAPLSGFLRSAAREHPRLRSLALDLDPRDATVAPGLIAREAGATDGEEDVAYRGSERYVRRLIATSRRGTGVPAVTGPSRLEITERGVLDNLRLVAAERRAPAAHEVEIEVRAAGLNFRDVLNALGMYPGDPGPLGSDCAGIVTRAGSDVEHLQVGDEVVGLVTDCFASFATGPAALLQKKPARLSFVAAVTVPNAFLTAFHALEQVGGMRRSERVLIHAATGGVGLAAVQLARAAGLEVFATAGSPRKRAFLQSMGVEHVMDSRSLAFADEIAVLTSGTGVNLVLNSISGPAIERSLSTLAPGGRFLEIGKNGIWTADEVARVRPDVRYTVVDLGVAIARDVASVRAPFVELLERLESGQLEPLPTETFPLGGAVPAFRHMSAARHIGKIVIVPPVAGETATPVGISCTPDSTYVVTGGFGGLGLTTARWLASRGAKRLMLIGRRQPAGEALAEVERLRASGVEILEAFGDVSSRDFLSSAFERIAASGYSLRGVVHAAGVLRDAPVEQLSWDQYAEVWAPKAAGAWNLHVLTERLPLDFFLMFSSMSAVLGAAGQAGYTASNSVLDGLAHARRTRGLPAVSINWGPWAEVGMAAGLTDRDRERWTAQGIGMMSPDQGLRALERVLESGSPQTSVLPIDWRRFLAIDGRARLPVLRMLAQTSASAAGAKSTVLSLSDRLAAADPQDRADLLRDHVREAVGAVLALDPAQLSETQGLTDIGMDSLMAVELSNRLSASIGKPLPTTLAFEQPTITALTAFVGELLGIAPAADAPASSERGSDTGALDEVMGLTDDEVASSLAAELEEAGY